MSSSSYKRIYAVVRRIPRGRVATYGQVFRGKVEEEFGGITLTMTHLEQLERFLKKAIIHRA